MNLNFLLPKRNALRRGDSVMLRADGKGSYPSVPTNILLKVTDVKNREATVIFVGNDDICEAKLPVWVLKRMY